MVRDAWERSWLALAIAAVIAAACFYATGGLNVGSATTTEMEITVGSGLLVAAAVAQEGARRTRIWGAGAAIAFFCVAAFTAVSLDWSVQPAYSWTETSLTFSYAAAFAGAVALVRLASGRWRSVISGILLATVAVSAYAVGTKVFPAGGASFARLNAPFNYWNVVGLMAALGVPPALWVGARRDGHGAQVALAGPAICLLLFTVVLAYSRGALVALIVGLAFWFVVTPLRLRSASVLLIGAAGAAIVAAWTLAQPALTTDNASLAARSPAGSELGWLLIGVMALCAGGCLALRFALLRNPPSKRVRHRAGVTLLVCLALVPLVALAGLAASSRGLFGSISHDVSTLTNTNVSVSNSANRLTALGSQRALYWSDAIKAFNTSPWIGTGADGFQTTFLRYDKSGGTTVGQAHSYIFQTLADLGLIGLAISLVLAAAWFLAAKATVGPFRRCEGKADTAERIGLLTMVTCVVIFTAHSTIDWTWFVPGVTLIALLCAGWVAGRGPHGAVLALGRPDAAVLSDRRRGVLAGAAVVLALLVAWSQWQPLRSQDSSNTALTALFNGEATSGAAAVADFKTAEADAERAISENPLDYTPLVWLADAEADLHHLKQGYATIVRAVRLQPSNPQTWYQLAQFDAYQLGAPKAALSVLSRSLFLYPESSSDDALYLQLLGAVNSATTRAAVKPAAHHASGSH
ncbi:MAG TPA: O-antigen ligase family protein [Solirubrobacteraceae bacterium]|nr:O-antigen ligase family protein [Solirubrobacteraceae bacterium]